ncbi:MBL fold metallo-hydrolase [Devosia elaeis]|uniref:Metallo-beta-lactamase domain-containing protein n=1 Tax=Devosia elaeis TaxID=1770058 RepID=A0A178I4H5_9HYPH|nr:MBL fold metallo-hydrolase [Devosia elaeis]OAM79058.1 hypothetical protein A3840_04375 [Devosia elaeis]
MSLSIQRRLAEAGMRRIILPMRSDNPALQHVNAWLGNERVLFDTGKDDPETRRVWDKLDWAQGLTAIYCTHAHADHMGLAHHFEKAYQVSIHISGAEMKRAQAAFARTPSDAALLREGFLLKMGADRPGASPSRPLGGRAAIPPAFYGALREDARIGVGDREWLVRLGGGHSVAPALFFDEKNGLLITGDQILPEMTPYVGVAMDAPDADPLGRMLNFLKSWTGVDASIIALPGHGAPFSNVGDRVAGHLASYERRLNRAWMAAHAPITGAGLLSALFRVGPGQQVLDIHYTMAAALLNHLVETGRMRRWKDDDGALQYQRL